MCLNFFKLSTVRIATTSYVTLLYFIMSFLKETNKKGLLYVFLNVTNSAMLLKPCSNCTKNLINIFRRSFSFKNSNFIHEVWSFSNYLFYVPFLFVLVEWFNVYFFLSPYCTSDMNSEIKNNLHAIYISYS